MKKSGVVTVTTIFSESQTTERDTRIDDPPAVPNEPTDHAVARGRDVSLRYEGGHSPENHTVVLETRCCKLHDQGARAPTASQRSRRAKMLSSGVGGAGEASRKL